MTKANTKINIALMNTLIQQAPITRQPRINEIIDLYKDGKSIILKLRQMQLIYYQARNTTKRKKQ